MARADRPARTRLLGWRRLTRYAVADPAFATNFCQVSASMVSVSARANIRTIDETMAELLQRKRSLIDAVTDGRVHDEERLVDAVVRELRGRPVRHLRVVA